MYKPTHQMQPEAAYVLLMVGILPPETLALEVLPKSFNNHRLHEMYEKRLAASKEKPKVYNFKQFWIELAKMQVTGINGEIINTTRLATLTDAEKLNNPQRVAVLRKSNHELFRPVLLNFRFYSGLITIGSNGEANGQRANGFAFDTGFYQSSEDNKFLCQKFNRMFQQALKQYGYTWALRRVQIGTSKKHAIFEAQGLEVL